MISEENHRIKEKINDILKSLNGRASSYIQDILTLINKDIGLNKVLSIVLFGSQRPNHGDDTVVSDCDLLIVFQDWVSNHNIRQIERYFMSLELKHEFRDEGKTLFGKILNVIQKTTGMFVSHFLTKKHYWEKAVFHKIFKVNKIFSSMFAPKKIVLCSAMDNSSMLYGEDLRRAVIQEVEIPHFDMIKSTAMNIMISIFSIGILPFKKLDPMKYALEAVKWALKASNYYSFEDSPSLETLARRFQHLEKYKISRRHARVFYGRFLRLRREPKIDIGFMLRCPLRILKIHIKGIIYYKALQRLKK